MLETGKSLSNYVEAYQASFFLGKAYTLEIFYAFSKIFLDVTENNWRFRTHIAHRISVNFKLRSKFIIFADFLFKIKIFSRLRETQPPKPSSIPHFYTIARL